MAISGVKSGYNLPRKNAVQVHNKWRKKQFSHPQKGLTVQHNKLKGEVEMQFSQP